MHTTFVRRVGAPLALSAIALLSAAPRANAATRLDWRVGGGFLDGGPVGEYFANESLNGAAAFTRRDVRIDFDWGSTLKPGGSISEAFQSVGNNNYSVRWTGRLKSRFSETYTFKVVCDDGVRLYARQSGAANWTTLINTWSNGVFTLTAPYTMNKANTYDLKLEYKEATGNAKCRLLWSSPSTPEEVIEAATSLGMRPPSDEEAMSDAFLGGSNFGELYPGNSTDPKKDGVLARDAAGWPAEDFTFLVRPADDRTVPGTYLVRFKGRADVTIHLVTGEQFQSLNGATNYGDTLQASSGTEGYDAASNTTTALVSIPAGQSSPWFQFTKTDRDGNFGGDGIADNDGLTAVTVQKPVAPSATTPHAAGELFDRGLKALWRRFTVTRWNDSNGAKLDDPNDGVNGTCFPDWAGRSRFLVPTQGVNHERKILWCNENGCDLWIQVYHHTLGDGAANAEYIRKLARLVRYGADTNGNPYTSFQAAPAFPGLNPNLKVYVEYSNEVPWNSAGQYPQSSWILQRADWEVTNSTAIGRILTFDGPATENQQRGRRYIAVRMKEISDIFREVWGDANMPGTAADPRVRPLLMGQYDNANIPRDTLYFLDRYYNNADGTNHVATARPVDYLLWSYGAASYYGCTNPYGEVDGFSWSNAGVESPALADGQAAIAPTNVTGWAFTGKGGVYRKAARTSLATGGNLVYTNGAAARAVYDFYGTGSEEVTVQDATTLEHVMKRPLVNGYRRAGQFVFSTQEDKYYPLILAPGGKYKFTGGTSVTLASTGVKSPSGANQVDLGFIYDPSEGSQGVFLAGTSSATVNLTLPESGAFGIIYDLAQIRDPNDVDGDGSAYPDTLNNPLDIFLVQGTNETRITARSRDDIDPRTGPWAHGDFGRHVDSFQRWGTAPFQASGSVRIRFKGTHADARYVVLLDNLRLASSAAIAESDMPVSGSATGENPTGDWVAQKRHQWTYAQAYGLHPGMYEGGWYPGGDWDRTPIQLYFSMKDPQARAVEEEVQALYAKVGVHFQCDYTLNLTIPYSDYNNPGRYERIKAWDTVLAGLPADEDNGMPPGTLFPTNSPWARDADTATGTVERRGGFFSWNVVVPEYGNYYLEAFTDRGASYKVFLDGSEVAATGTASNNRTSAMVNGLAKGIHNLRLQSTDAASFKVLNLAITRATSAAPTVDAGPSREIRLPLDTASLDGTVTDTDSTPQTRWSVYAAPAGARVVFGNSNAVDTTAQFDRPGDYVLRLAATDGPLTVSDLTGVSLEPAGTNQLRNSGFGNPAQFVPTDTWLESATDTGRGWMVVTDSRWNLDTNASVAVADGSGYRTMAQIVEDNSVTRSWQLLSFRAKNQGTGNTLNVHVFGVQTNKFLVPLADERGPLATDYQTPVGQRLLKAEVGANSYDWTEFRYPVDVGGGYRYLVILVFSDGVSGTEIQSVDDIELSGGKVAVLADGAFTGGFTTVGSWASSDSHAGAGWLIASPTNSRWNYDSARDWASADNSGVPTFAQIVRNHGALRGQERVAFDALNNSTAGKLKFYLWGVREPFRLNLYDINGPRKINPTNWNIPADAVLLVGDQAVGGEVYPWTVQEYPAVNFSNGFEYLAVQFFTESVDPALGRTQAVDNAVIGPE